MQWYVLFSVLLNIYLFSHRIIFTRFANNANYIFFCIFNCEATLKGCNMYNILSRNTVLFSSNRNVIFPNQECSKTIYLFSLHYHFKSIAAEWRRLCRTDLQKPSLSYRNNLLEIFCRPILARYLWFSDRLLRILGF